MVLAKHNIAIHGYIESIESTNLGNLLDLLELRSKESLILQEFLKKSSLPYTSPTFQNKLMDIIGKKCPFKDYRAMFIIQIFFNHS